jgi:phosphoglycolate phosphatase
MDTLTPFFRVRDGFTPQPQISHVLFGFDGTLSWLRHGWPEIMCRLFCEQVPLQPGETAEELHALLLKDLLSLNGGASIHQMESCATLAAQRGAPKPDPQRLLLEYQRRLDTEIEKRTGQILNGWARPDDFVVHGARWLLERLQERGITLILLSGTAEPRLRQEAQLLGLAPYFGRHIYGGAAPVAQSPTRAVVGRLLHEEKLSRGNLLSFGDSPVELRLAKEIGGLAVGVAGDDDQNGSGRMHPEKAVQLWEAGADILISDYRDADALLDLVFGPL